MSKLNWQRMDMSKFPGSGKLDRGSLWRCKPGSKNKAMPGFIRLQERTPAGWDEIYNVELLAYATLEVSKR